MHKDVQGSFIYNNGKLEAIKCPEIREQKSPLDGILCSH